MIVGVAAHAVNTSLLKDVLDEIYGFMIVFVKNVLDKINVCNDCWCDRAHIPYTHHSRRMSSVESTCSMIVGVAANARRHIIVGGCP